MEGLTPCSVACETRAELYARVMERQDALEALVLRLERWEWPDPKLVARARGLLTYPGS